MADTGDLHQIEYRHHQTNDLSPIASSMTSRESLAAWHARIRAWVRHPHADNLSESACYQVFPNGQAALAWRYWDERAASREDGTHGRPLVSRVLIGSASVLTFDVALAWSRTGPSAQWLGPPPGQVPDGSQLPLVSGEAVIAVAREMAPALDQASAVQEGLHAVVAARLDEPSAPLAISMPDTLVQLPLPQCVQCPLLWGLHRIAGPLLGSAGRDWSFSTFELALGETDPTSLPAIVFREARDGVKAPPSRWRKEAKVRPFEPDALDDGTPYAKTIEFADWLVTEYRARGGDGLEHFIAEHAGSVGPSALRMERIWHALEKSHRPTDASGYQRQTLPQAQDPVAGGPAKAAPQGAERLEPERREPERQQLTPREPGPEEWETQEWNALVWEAPEPAVEDTQESEETQETQETRESEESEETEETPPTPAAQPPDDDYRDPIDARVESVRHELVSAGSVSSLLKQLELLGKDPELFQSLLDGIYQASAVTPEEREKSWSAISGGWYENIGRNNSFRSGDLARIFTLVVIPDLLSPPRAEAVATWALEAPAPMVEGLLAAAQADGQETWDAAIMILEPTIALRWMVEHYLRDYWQGVRTVRPHAGSEHVDSKAGFLGGLRRRSGGRHRG